MISLLYPDNYKPSGKTLGAAAVQALELDYIAMLICPYNTEYALEILTELITDEAAIRWRQDILEDFVNVPQLERNLHKSLKTIYDNACTVYAKSGSTQSFFEIQENISSMESFISCMNECREFAAQYGGKLRSEGIRRILAEIEERCSSDSFRSLIKEVDELKTALEKGVKSVTFAVNFDDVMRPAEIMLLSVEDEPVRRKTRFERLLSREKTAEPISDIYVRKTKDGQIQALNERLFQELDGLCGGYMKRVNIAIKRCYEECTEFLVKLSQQIDFYVGARTLAERAQQMGLPTCRPKILPRERRTFHCKAMHDPVLTNKLLSELVRERNRIPVYTNDCTMDDEARLLILTGSNNGGKTTYIRAAGVNQILAQAGLFVYAEQAEISPCDCVFFHYPQEEKAGINTSRFTEECKYFRRTIGEATEYSLVLMNESLSGTNPYDSLLIGEELLRIFSDMGCRLIFATHILELAELPEKLNSPDSGSKLISLTAECDENGVPTYHIAAGKPDRSRNAQYIFEKYGISYREYCRSRQNRQ